MWNGPHSCWRRAAVISGRPSGEGGGAVPKTSAAAIGFEFSTSPSTGPAATAGKSRGNTMDINHDGSQHKPVRIGDPSPPAPPLEVPSLEEIFGRAFIDLLPALRGCRGAVLHIGGEAS